MKVIPLIPENLPRGMIAEVFPSAGGGFDLAIWRDASRDDGLMFDGLPDMKAVRKHVALVVEASNERA